MNEREVNPDLWRDRTVWRDKNPHGGVKVNDVTVHERLLDSDASLFREMHQSGSICH